MAKKLPKKSAAGPPFRTGKPTQTVGVRLDRDELGELDRAAALLGGTRGEIIRDGALRYARKLLAGEPKQGGKKAET